jgi:predicted phage baseplate assembly protein
VQIPLNQLSLPDARNRRYFQLLPVVQGASVTDNPIPGGVSDGTPNQMYTLSQKPVIAHSIRVSVNESGGVTTHWLEVDSLANSSPADRHFVVQRDAEGAATIVFGDGISGLIPPASTSTTPVTIQASYRIGGGAQGNVPARTQFRPTATLPGNVTIIDAFNPLAAAGGAGGEDVDRARAFAPRLFRTQDRAVTAEDFVDLTLQVPGVGKVLAVASGWNGVQLYVAPSGQVTPPSESLQRDVLAFLESKRMLTTNVTILGPLPADIFIQATVFAKPYFLQSDVKAKVEKVIAAYLAFDAVEFGQAIFLSRVYDLIQSLPEVDHLNITLFSRSSSADGVGVDPPGVIQLASNELARPGYPTAILADIRGGVQR